MRILDELLKRISNHVTLYYPVKDEKKSEEKTKRKLSNFELNLPLSKAINLLVRFCQQKSKYIVQLIEQILEGWISASTYVNQPFETALLIRSLTFTNKSSKIRLS